MEGHEGTIDIWITLQFLFALDAYISSYNLDSLFSYLLMGNISSQVNKKLNCLPCFN